MQRSWLFALLLCSFLAHLQQVQAETPQNIIKKAIEAYGGETSVAKLKVIRAKAKGTVNLGADVPFTWEFAWQWPNQFKLFAELEASGKKVALLQGFDGAQGWVAAKGVTVAVEGRKLADLKAQADVRRILTLTPLLTDKTYELTALDDVTVGENITRGVKVTTPGQREVKLYFDKQTGLLAKLERFVLDDAKMEEVSQEEFPSDFQEVDGVKTALKEVWLRSGKKVAELQYTEVTYPEKIEDREFLRPSSGLPADLPATHTADVIYGRKFGMALTMDLFTPKSGANGAAIILVMSGGWVSDNQALNSTLIGSFLAEPIKRGFTVITVFHGSQPKFTIPEVIADINRAVRFIRLHASDYNIDPHRIGIMGGSAGGHLSLMLGTAGDLGNAKSGDPLERQSSRVQAVACLFPPTDFLNYGAEGKYAFGNGGILAPYRAVVDVRELDSKTFQLERSTDLQKQLELAAKISPTTHVSKDAAPTLIIHGDADVLVPIQQAELIVAKLKAAGVKAELITRRGRGHDFAGVDKDIAAMTDWFDEHLKQK